MSGFLAGTWLIASLELRQRVRGVAWYVLLGVFVFVILCVTVLLVLATNALQDGGGGVFSTIIFFVLLLGTLVSPALSGNAVNGEREAGTLATTQVTLITTSQIVIGKWLAAWITAIAFLVGALPFLIFAVALGEVSALTVFVSTIVLAVELGIIAAIGVGLSGILTRPLFSIVVTYLVIAALSIGTVIVFGLAGAATQSQARSTYIGFDYDGVDYDATFDPETGLPLDGVTVACLPPEVSTYSIPRFDYYWPVLAANPYVVLADAAPPVFNAQGQGEDLFTWIAVGVRGAQHAPDLDRVDDYCADPATGGNGAPQTPEDLYADSVASWFVGLALQVVLAAGALLWAIRRTRTPADRLPKGMRVA
ncbi:MAG: ABC transporter permease [Leifsonia sp.]